MSEFSKKVSDQVVFKMSYSSVVNNILKITVVSLLFLTIQISQL